MIRKRLILTDKIKNRVINVWDRDRIYDHILHSGEEYDLYNQALGKFKNKLINLIETYILDAQTVALYKENPLMFKYSNQISIDPKILGIDVSAFDIKLDVSLNFSYKIPFGGYKFSIDKDMLNKFPEVDLNVLKDLCSDVYNASYKSTSRIWNKGRRILDGVSNYGQLFRYNTELYEYYVKRRFGAGCLQYEEYDDGTAKESDSEARKRIINDNKSINKEILEKLKTKIKL